MYATDMRLELRRLIAVNEHYICYGLKQGHVRVINKVSAERDLLKGHTAPITDLRWGSQICISHALA